nr:immunoglobulin light chain junction region [Macaca mulatta]MOV34376.1 immunoglobulin light chain junction region [Macaca mulatta]MOV35377.1 immunoglobulin light chain junction region [Macaca mulatta]MOX86535.1 immunoglobulin light chain junction region [Macaca mulatta]
CVQGLEFPLTF